MKTGLHILVDRQDSILKMLHELPDMGVLVGIPEGDKAREDGSPINNATLGYIHENGAPEMHIPARPFLVPGVRSAQVRVSSFMKQAGKLALEGKADGVTKAFHAAGMVASVAVKKFIVAGNFEPLSDATLRARARRAGKGKGVAISKGAQAELASREAGNSASTEFAKPLNDTAQLRNSITYIVRQGGKDENG